jgi:hypothetical protein
MESFSNQLLPLGSQSVQMYNNRVNVIPLAAVLFQAVIEFEIFSVDLSLKKAVTGE